MRSTWIAMALLVGTGFGCADGTHASETTLDTGGETADDTRAETTDTGAETTVSDTADETDDEVTPGPFGFAIREPRQDRLVPCDIIGIGNPDGDFTSADEDYVCTFAYGGVTATTYFQTTPTGCFLSGVWAIPTYEARGWVSKGGVVTPISASYDVGGNHRIRVIYFVMDGDSYDYAHSSLIGGRACAPPDCLQHFTDGMVDDDGCTPARTLPIVCNPVQADGTFGPLEDTFTKCPGG